MSIVDGGGLPAGTQLNGIYEIERRIGKGGMGEVYAGREIHSGARVAIKMVLPELVHDQKIVELFTREATTLNRLHHEGIVSYSVFSIDPVLRRPYLAMEFAEGPSLKARLRRGRPLTEQEFESLQHRIAGALDAAHRAGIVHRDMSPDNIVLIDDNVDKAKIIDFGIAKSMGAERTLIGHDLAGKLSYMSPEQIGLAGGEVNEKSDIYALGLVFAEALTAKSMNMGGTQAEAVEKRRTLPDLSAVPKTYRPLIEWMLQPDPAKRPASMREVASWRPGAADRKDGGGGRKGGGFGTILKMVAGVVLGLAIVGVVILFLLPEPIKLEPFSTGHVEASKGTVGAPYRWQSPAFTYSGATPLELKLDGTLPAGLTFTDGGDGIATISGTPIEPGEIVLEVEAFGESDSSAVQTVRLVIVAPPPPPNQPPAVVESVKTEIRSEVGEVLDLDLGIFSDDGGVARLRVGIEGVLPAGLRFTVRANGVAALTGTPAEPGRFGFNVVAADAEGLAARFPVSLVIDPKEVVVTPPPTQPPLTLTEKFIAQYNLAPCLFVRAIELGDNRATIEAFADRGLPINQLDVTFKRDLGFEANIRGRIITGAQCDFLDRLSSAGADRFDRGLRFDMTTYKPVRGEPFKGILANGATASLFLVDSRGRVSDLRSQRVAAARDLEFRTSLNGTGPQIILAAVSDSGRPVTIDQALDPAMRGRIRLAISYLDVR